MTNCQVVYPLLPFSQFVYDLTRTMHKTETNHYAAFLIHDVLAEEVCMSIQTALRAHSVFNIRLNQSGKQYAGEERNVLSGPFHKIDIQQQGEDVYVKVVMNLILGDNYSMRILLEDAVRAYQGEPLESDNYWGYVQRYEEHKLSSHYINSMAWLQQEFSDDAVPVRPHIDRLCLWKLLPMRAGIYDDDYTTWQIPINQFVKEKLLPIDGFFSLCVALAIADYCGATNAALTWAYKGRERPEEQRIVGSLHRDVPFKIKAKGRMDEWRKEELIKEARNQIRQGIAHSDYPYTLTAPYNKRWNYAVNVLCVEDEKIWQKMLPSQIEFLPSPVQKYAYAMLDVEIHELPEQLQLCFRYSASHYKESSIHKFAALVRKYVEWLIND